MPFVDPIASGKANQPPDGRIGSGVGEQQYFGPEDEAMQLVTSGLFLVFSNPDPKREANQARTWEIHSRSGDQKQMSVYHDGRKILHIVKVEPQAARLA